jgi:hypothetical protein
MEVSKKQSAMRVVAQDHAHGTKIKVRIVAEMAEMGEFFLLP